MTCATTLAVKSAVDEILGVEPAPIGYQVECYLLTVLPPTPESVPGYQSVEKLQDSRREKSNLESRLSRVQRGCQSQTPSTYPPSCARHARRLGPCLLRRAAAFVSYHREARGEHDEIDLILHTVGHKTLLGVSFDALTVGFNSATLSRLRISRYSSWNAGRLHQPPYQGLSLSATNLSWSMLSMYCLDLSARGRSRSNMAL